jgi:chitodextrinase
MKFIDLAKEFSTTVGLNDIVLAGVVGAGFQTFAGYSVGEIVPYKMGMGAEWECGEGVKTANGIARTTITSSSNANAKVPFSAGTKEVSCNVGANFLTGVRRERAGEVDLVSALPLDFKGDTFIKPYIVAGPLTLTVGAGAVRNAYLYARFTAGTTDIPALPGSELIGSAGYDNRAGILNMLQGWFDGYDFLYTWTQKANAAPADTTGPTMNGTLSSSAVTTVGFTLTWAAASDAVGVTGYEYSIDGGTTYTNAGNVLAKAIAGLIAATGYPCRVRAYDGAGNRSLVPLSLTVTTAATADSTVPSMSGSLTVDNITASGYRMNWPAGADNVAVTGYETSTDGSTTYSDAGNVLNRTIAGATAATLYNLRVRAYDAAGNRSAPLSATVTTSAAAADTSIRMNRAMAKVTESGSAPWTYAATGTATSAVDGTVGAVSTLAMPSGADASVTFKVLTVSAEIMFQIGQAGVVDIYNNNLCAWTKAGKWQAIVEGGTQPAPLTDIAVSVNDLVRFTRSGVAAAADYRVPTKIEVSKNGGASWQDLYIADGVAVGTRRQTYYAKVVPAAGAVLSAVASTGMV